MSHNLAARSREERDKINVDLAASGVAFKERLQHYRNVALQFPRGSDPVYQREEKL